MRNLQYHFKMKGQGRKAFEPGRIQKARLGARVGGEAVRSAKTSREWGMERGFPDYWERRELPRGDAVPSLKSLNLPVSIAIL